MTTIRPFFVTRRVPPLMGGGGVPAVHIGPNVGVGIVEPAQPSPPKAASGGNGMGRPLLLPPPEMVPPKPPLLLPVSAEAPVAEVTDAVQPVVVLANPRPS